MRKLAIVIVLGSALLAGIFVATKSAEPEELRSARILPVANPIAEFSLLNQFGESITSDVFRGQWDLVFFGFTHCPDICPTTLQTLSSAKHTLADNGATELPRIVLVSVDPERDTPDILRRYVEYFGDANLGITGGLDDIGNFASATGIYFQKTQEDDDGYSVDHSAAVLAINPEGEFAALFSAPHTVADYVHDLPILMNN